MVLTRVSSSPSHPITTRARWDRIALAAARTARVALPESTEATGQAPLAHSATEGATKKRCVGIFRECNPAKADSKLTRTTDSTAGRDQLHRGVLAWHLWKRRGLYVSLAVPAVPHGHVCGHQCECDVHAVPRGELRESPRKVSVMSRVYPALVFRATLLRTTFAFSSFLSFASTTPHIIRRHPTLVSLQTTARSARPAQTAPLPTPKVFCAARFASQGPSTTAHCS